MFVLMISRAEGFRLSVLAARKEDRKFDLRCICDAWLSERHLRPQRSVVLLVSCPVITNPKI